MLRLNVRPTNCSLRRISCVSESLKVCAKLVRLPVSTVLATLVLSFSAFASDAPLSGTTSFVLDGNRIYAEIAFARADGTMRKTRALVDLGSPSMSMSPALFKELGVDHETTLSFKIGDMSVSLSASEVSADDWFPFSVGSDPKVEALLPAGIMQRYQVAIDYRQRTLTLAEPETLTPEGIPVHFRLNEKTGLIVVDASIAGHSYPVTIDNGSAYTWLRQAIVAEWLRAHPEWERGIGAVGASNMRMADDGIEGKGTLVRIPEIRLGAVRVQQVGALGIGPSNDNRDLIDWYSKKNSGPVSGWFGGNVMRGFRLTIDYRRRTMYWLRQTALDPHDLDQVGLTLKQQSGEYFVAAVVTQNGKPTVEGVVAGDKLVEVGALRLGTASWGAVFSALHGKPGELRTLVVERGGERITVHAKVVSF